MRSWLLITRSVKALFSFCIWSFSVAARSVDLSPVTGNAIIGSPVKISRLLNLNHRLTSGRNFYPNGNVGGILPSRADTSNSFLPFVSGWPGRGWTWITVLPNFSQDMTKPVLTFSKLDPETGDLLDRMFDKKDCMSEINPGRVILPADYMTIGQDILDMEVKDTDVWMCSYPRTGSTWAQEMVWLIGHDLDYEGAKSLQQIRCPLVELSCIMVAGHSTWHKESVQGTSVDLVKHRLPYPRYIRSHLPWDLLPVDIEKDDGSAKPKVIYTSRNPKDMVVSYYHYCTLVHGLKGTFEEFCDLFMKDRAPFGPVWNHILGFWNRRHDPNVLFIKFEEMKHDLPSVVRRTATFLNKELSDTQVDKLCDHLSFQNMKTNRAVNLEAILEKSFGVSYLESTDLRFIRKGEIGDWKNYMSDDLSRRFDEWAEKHLKGTELSFE